MRFPAPCRHFTCRLALFLFSEHACFETTAGSDAGRAAGGAHLQRGVRPGGGLLLVRVQVRNTDRAEMDFSLLRVSTRFGARHTERKQ